MLSRSGLINIIQLSCRHQSTDYHQGVVAALPVAAWRGAGSNPAGDIYFHFEFSIPACSEQLSGSHANEIKHDHSPVVVVVLDPRYD